MSTYTDFFVASSSVAGAVTGLLFVSLSIAPERLAGEHASVERQSVAATAFTALVDALWLGLFALRPGNNIPTASLVLGLISLTSTTGLTVRLWRARHREQLSNRWPFLLLVIIGLYGYQTSTAFTAGSSEAAQSDAATLVFVLFGVGLARAWELLGLRGGGLLDLLTTAARRAGPGDGAGHELAGPDSGSATGRWRALPPGRRGQARRGKDGECRSRKGRAPRRISAAIERPFSPNPGGRPNICSA